VINGPDVLVADEPTGALDSASTDEVLRLLAQQRTLGRAVLVVTHDPQVAATADRVLTMRDGRLVDQTLLGAQVPLGLSDLLDR